MATLFAKCLAENWFGREETLRWVDCEIYPLKAQLVGQLFFNALRQRLLEKRSAYLEQLTMKEGTLIIDCHQILSYWASPPFTRELQICIRVTPNRLTLPDFFNQLQSQLYEAYRTKLRVSDVTDLFHLYSLYHDAKVTEVWSCNQAFAKRHERHLKFVPTFADLFDPRKVRIVRIIR